MTIKEISQKLHQFVNEVSLGYKGTIDLNLLREAADRLEELEKQNEAMIKELCDKEDLVREAEGRFYELEKQLSEKQSEWISVEKRLPGADGRYITYNGEDIKIRSFDPVRQGSWIIGEVTHWMPLPEPPKPKEPTFKDKFLEMFPKAELNNFRVPVVCAGALFSYLRDSCNTSDCSYNGREYQEKCYVCWNQPYFEEEGESGE